MKQIIYLDEVRLEREIEEYTVERFLKKEKFKAEYRDFMANMYSMHTDFKFPTILCEYRTGINPSIALYHELQKTLFQYKRQDKKHKWIISLFKNKEWYEFLINSIRKDINTMIRMVNNYSPYVQCVDLCYSDLLKIRGTIKEFKHYLEVFEMMKDLRK